MGSLYTPLGKHRYIASRKFAGVSGVVGQIGGRMLTFIILLDTGRRLFAVGRLQRHCSSSSCGKVVVVVARIRRRRLGNYDSRGSIAAAHLPAT